MGIRHFAYPSIVGHLGCFHFWAIGNNAVMNMGRQISIRVPAFNSLGYIPRSGKCNHFKVDSSVVFSAFSVV